MLDGTAHAPGQPWKHGKQTIKTLWGELAWQLGGSEAFALVKEADANGTSPGKDVLRDLLERYAPCVVLIDELVAYIRQFPEGQTLSGGSYESNLSFIQALTEAVKLVPKAVVLASLPETEVEAGSQSAAVRRAASLGERFRPCPGIVEAGRDRRGVRDRSTPAVRAGPGRQGPRRRLPGVCRRLRRRRGQTPGRNAGKPVLRPPRAGVPDSPGSL